VLNSGYRSKTNFSIVLDDCLENTTNGTIYRGTRDAIEKDIFDDPLLFDKESLVERLIEMLELKESNVLYK
jgi:hypothetical protein